MRFGRIIAKVYEQPWLITPQAHATIRRLLDSKLAGTDIVSDLFGEPLPEMSVEHGIATIPIKGVILQGASKLEKTCGAVGTEDIEDNITAALDNDAVSALFLDISSPGGSVGGVPELGDLVAQAAQIKPVYAHTTDLMASAAYWLAAGATEVLASKSAEVGSIGVYMPWLDSSVAYEKQGLKMEVIHNEGADLKGMGMPGTSLTDVQREELQRTVDEIGRDFRTHVELHRGSLANDTFRGQTFGGKSAQLRGLVDMVISRKDALENLKKLVSG